MCQHARVLGTSINPVVSITNLLNGGRNKTLSSRVKREAKLEDFTNRFNGPSKESRNVLLYEIYALESVQNDVHQKPNL